jgi:hypothetical protein
MVSVDERLAAVEAALGIDPRAYRETPYERAVRAVEEGRATRRDFEMWCAPDLHWVRAVIVVRSRLFRQARDTGLEPYAPQLPECSSVWCPVGASIYRRVRIDQTVR